MYRLVIETQGAKTSIKKDSFWNDMSHTERGEAEHSETL